MWQYGGDLFSEDATTATWADEPGVKAMTWYGSDQERQLARQDRPGRRLHRLAERQDRHELERHLGINTLKEKKDLQWGVADCPTSAAPRRPGRVRTSSCCPPKAADENKAVASRVFLNWISQQSLEWAKAGQVPVRNTVRESAEFTALTEQATLAKQIDYLHFLPPVAGIGDAMAEWDKALNEAVHGHQGPAGRAVGCRRSGRQDPAGQPEEVRG